MFRDGRARIDYAAGYLAELPTAPVRGRGLHSNPRVCRRHYRVVSLPDARCHIGLATALTLLAPERLFRQIRHNLRADGLYFMVNHGLQEAESAKSLCTAAGLKFRGALVGTGTLSRHRMLLPVTLLVEARLDKIFVFYQQIAVPSAPAREFLLGPFLVTAPLPASP